MSYKLHRRCGWTTAGMLLGLAGILCASKASAVTYHLTPLGVLPGDTRSYAQGVNAYGQVVGYSRGSGVAHAFLWTPSTANGTTGTMMNLGDLPGGAASAIAYGINSYGQVVGTGTTANGGHAFLWTPTVANGTTGSMIDLGDLLGGSGTSGASGINSLGQVTGSSASGSTSHAFLWTPSAANGTSGSMVDLGDLSGGSAYSQGNAINSYGEVTGSVTVGTTTHAMLWVPSAANGATGAMSDLGDLGDGMLSSRGQAINEAGEVAGGSFTGGSSNEPHVIRWTPAIPHGSSGSMSDLGTFAQGYITKGGWGNGIDDVGHVVGMSLRLRARVHSCPVATNSRSMQII